MSLINDALKKAKKAQRENPAPLSTQHFRPVESGPRPSPWYILLPLAVVFLSAIGGVSLWMALQKRGVIQEPTVLARQNQSPPQPDPKQSSATQLPQADETREFAGASRPAETPRASDSISAQPAPPPEQAESISGEQVVDRAAGQQTSINAPAEPPLPIVRGIFLNPSHPSAVLNNKTVYVGDRVIGFEVISITPDSVTVVRSGKTNVLTLPE